MVTKPSTARGAGFMLAAQFQTKPPPKKKQTSKKKTLMAETLDSIKNVDHIMTGY